MVLLLTQILFTLTTLWAKYNLLGAESFSEAVQQSWLVIYGAVYLTATFLQLYVFKVTNILKAMAFFSGLSLILTIVFGCVLFGEILDWRDILSIILVVSALSLIGHQKISKADVNKE